MNNSSQDSVQSEKPSKAGAWVVAARPRTLPLALASIGMGSFLAGAVGSFSWLIFALCVLTTIFLQVLSNFANDYGDTVHGADSGARTGPKRVTQQGLISREEMKRGMGITAVCAMFSGLALLYVAFGWAQLLWFLLFALLGGAAIWAAIAYTATSKPYGYVGLGDLFVFLFFGWVGTLGSYFVQVQPLDWLILLPATSVGLFCVGVLNVNNMRDIESDVLAGKRSIPVRLGLARARWYHLGLLLGGVICAGLYTWLAWQSDWQLLWLLSVPLMLGHGRAIFTRPATSYDPLLKQLVGTTLLFVLLFGAGLLL
jgi:1,4-dihydroxy-2-naphthoate polyprenyltransferase